MQASSRTQARLSALSVALLLAASAQPAFAQPAPAAAPTPDTVESARDAFRRGADLAKAGNFGDAVLAFEQSYRLKPHPVTSYNLGYCERALGHSTRARALFERAFAEHRAALYGPLPDDLVQLAQQYLAELDAHLARLEIKLASKGALLAVDGEAPEPAAHATSAAPPVFVVGARQGARASAALPAYFVLLLDPGPHSFTFSEQGVAQPAIQRTLAPGSRSTLDQPAPSPLLATQPAAPTSVSSPAATSNGRTWAYVALGVGIAGLATGGIAGGLALSKKSTLDDACGPTRRTCPSRGTIDDMNQLADISTVGFVVGIAGVGTALGLYLWGAPSSSSSRAKSSAAAGSGRFSVAPNRVSFSGAF